MLTCPSPLARIGAVVMLAAAPVLAACTGADRVGPTPGASSPPAAGSTTTRSPLPAPRPLGDHDELATGLAVPWSVGFLPDRSALVTLRDTGQIVRLVAGRPPVVVGTVQGVEKSSGEGGLLGIAIPEDFDVEPVVYVYLTTDSDNRIAAIPFAGNQIGRPRVILSGIPHAPRHDGGRIAFGPDGYLYAGTGDAAQPDLAQDRSSLAGKILRITPDGQPAPGNPFPGSPVYSLGHRNVEGLAWDDDGRLWASEFGQDTWDELNLITAGGNYGWPRVEGMAGEAGLIDPARVWRPVDASPSGLAFGPDGALYLAALRGQSVWRIPLDANGSTGEPARLMQGVYGRLRDVVAAPDGSLWVVTNNTSRGAPRPGDDRIVRLVLG